MKKKFKILTCSIMALLIMVTPLMFAGCEKTNTNSTMQKVDLREAIVNDKEIKSVVYYEKETESSSTLRTIYSKYVYKIDGATLYDSNGYIIAERGEIEDYLFIAGEGLENYETTSKPIFASQLGMNGNYFGSKYVNNITYQLSVVSNFPIDVCFSDSLVHIFAYEEVSSNEFVSTEDLKENKNNQYYKFTEIIRPIDWITEIVYE